MKTIKSTYHTENQLRLLLNAVKYILAIIMATLFYNPIKSQPADIMVNATPATNVMNPDGDEWSSFAGTPYIINDIDESEINWTPMPILESEPSSDINGGANCGKTDLIGDGANSGQYPAYYTTNDPDGIYNNGDELFLFRLRIADLPAGGFGYSVLFDTDIKFGQWGVNKDPNYVAGNPGFELEIRVSTSGSSGVKIWDVDGTTTGTLMTSYALSSNAQFVEALWQYPGCTGTPTFIDFFVNIADMGIDLNTPIRMVTATATSPGSVLGGSASDIAGINDKKGPPQDSLLVLIVDVFPPMPLPVQLLSFDCIPQKEHIDIQWNTATENNTDYYVIEKAIGNNFDFQKIATIKAAGNILNESKYIFSDINPKEGINYYRIKIVDLNGMYMYAGIRNVKFESISSKIVVYPNPVFDKLIVKIKNLNNTEDLTVFLLDSKGRELKRKVSKNNKEFKKVEFNNLQAMASGIYLIQIQNESGTTLQFSKIIKK